MVQIETTLGYGFHVSCDQAQKIGQIESDFVLRPMCHTCCQSPYFFGLVMRTINSKQAYIEFDIPYDDFKNLHSGIRVMLELDYERIFGRMPPFEPQFMMFTDIKVV